MRRSWVAGAEAPASDFPIANLPYGVFSTGGGPRRVGVAIGEAILDLTALEAEGVLRPGGGAAVFGDGVLNPFMALGAEAWRATRAAIGDLLDAQNPRLRDDAELTARMLVPRAAARMHLPVFVRSFTDFYASRAHATNVGRILRGAASALAPNWLHMPIGYNGRASSVVVSGTGVRRPVGQILDPGAGAPRFGPSGKLDFELEIAAIVGTGSEMGRGVSTAEAAAMIFGYVLLNDWSARDIQAWEYRPLGPFQSKAFATSISPWVVTAEALAPFRVPLPPRELPLLPYLDEAGPGGIDLALEVTLAPARGAPAVICRSNARHLYFSPAQMLAHHAASGCGMCTGDLVGSGTISGEAPGSFGSLIEITRDGRDPLVLPDGGARGYLADGDSVTLAGWCGAGAARIGFGTCSGRIHPAAAPAGAD